MWDLIVSVPDHCLSFYFLLGLELPVSYSSRINWGNVQNTGDCIKFYFPLFYYCLTNNFTVKNTIYALKNLVIGMSKLHVIHVHHISLLTPSINFNKLIRLDFVVGKS